MNKFLFSLVFLSYSDLQWLLGNMYVVVQWKSLYLIMWQYDIASLGAKYERQDRQVDCAQSEAQHTCKPKQCLSNRKVVMRDLLFQWTG